MISYSDIEKFIKNALDVRVNSDVTKTLNQVISEAITNARDNINTTTNNTSDTVKTHVTSIVNAARDVISAHITACKDAIFGHGMWIKDELAGKTATEANNTRVYLEGQINKKGTVKSVQRGHFSQVGLPLTINFAKINADKSMVFINGNSSVGNIHKRSVTSNSMQITAGYGYPEARTSGDWEIIEYY